MTESATGKDYQANGKERETQDWPVSRTVKRRRVRRSNCTRHRKDRCSFGAGEFISASTLYRHVPHQTEPAKLWTLNGAHPTSPPECMLINRTLPKFDLLHITPNQKTAFPNIDDHILPWPTAGRVEATFEKSWDVSGLLASTTMQCQIER